MKMLQDVGSLTVVAVMEAKVYEVGAEAQQKADIALVAVAAAVVAAVVAAELMSEAAETEVDLVAAEMAAVELVAV